MSRKRIIVVAVVFVVLLVGVYLLVDFSEEEESETTTPIPEAIIPDPVREVLGTSVEGREIEAYTYGSGDIHLVFVGGIHGGYEWNTTLLAYRFLDHLEERDDLLVDDLSVTIIPSLNPDGLYKITGSAGRFDPNLTPTVKETEVGRFNAKGVDLNRNFDCNWQPESTWRGQTVDAGSEAFSEPEAAAFRDYVSSNNLSAVVFLHSAANGVYGSSCNNGILDDTVKIMNIYAAASGYPAVESFDHYEITGDAEGWLAKLNIPSVSVELMGHETLEWEKNKAGFEAILKAVATGDLLSN